MILCRERHGQQSSGAMFRMSAIQSRMVRNHGDTLPTDPSSRMQRCRLLLHMEVLTWTLCAGSSWPAKEVALSGL